MIALDTIVVSEVLKPTPNGRGLADLFREQSMREWMSCGRFSGVQVLIAMKQLRPSS
jgi:hypothetical protein